MSDDGFIYGAIIMFLVMVIAMLTGACGPQLGIHPSDPVPMQVWCEQPSDPC